MRAVRVVIGIVSAGVVGIGASACGSGPVGVGASSVTVPAGRQAIDRHDVLVDEQVRALHKAALAGDRVGVDRAEQRLDRLARSDPAPESRSAASDPYERAIDEFAFKRAPLYVQQISTTQGSHRVDVGVDAAAFCLLSVDARLAAVDGVYAPMQRRLRADGVSDLRFVVVPVTRTRATLDQALAIGRHGAIGLTRRGRGC